MSSNLPPGCSESDIPGNRPEDFAEEALAVEINELLQPVNDLGEHVLIGWETAFDKTHAMVMDFVKEQYEAGRKAAMEDEKMARGCASEELYYAYYQKTGLRDALIKYLENMGETQIAEIFKQGVKLD